jgi:hypothetical protein
VIAAVRITAGTYEKSVKATAQREHAMRRLVFPIGFSILVATMSWMRIAHADPIYADQGANNHRR